MDSGTFLGIASILATVLFSGIGIFYGITAKKERVKKASEIILDTLLTLVVNERKIPTREEITRLGKLKCMENKIKLSSLPSEDEYLDLVYAKILESKLISNKKRQLLLTLFSKESSNSVNEKSRLVRIEEVQNLREEKNASEEYKDTKYITLLAGLLTAIISAIIFFLTFNNDIFRLKTFESLTAIIIPILLTVLSLQIILRFKNIILDIDQKKSRPDIIENQLRKIAEIKNARFHKEFRCEGISKSSHYYFDYCIETSKKRYYIETKNYNQLVGMGSSIYKLTLNNLIRTVTDRDKSKLILILTNAPKSWHNHFEEKIAYLEGWSLILPSDNLKSLKEYIE